MEYKILSIKCFYTSRNVIVYKCTRMKKKLKFLQLNHFVKKYINL